MYYRSSGRLPATAPGGSLRQLQGRFVAWYGTDDAPTNTIDVEKCGLCGGDFFKKDNFKDAVAAAHSVRDRTNIKRE